MRAIKQIFRKFSLCKLKFMMQWLQKDLINTFHHFQHRLFMLVVSHMGTPQSVLTRETAQENSDLNAYLCFNFQAT